MTRVREHLTSLIAAEGPISIAEFMRTALAAYYAKGDPLGADGVARSGEINKMYEETA